MQHLVTSPSGERQNSSKRLAGVQGRGGGGRGGVKPFESAARSLIFLGVEMGAGGVEMQDGGGGGFGEGGVSVRLTGFVLSLFVLQESDERLPRRLALQRDDTRSETVMEHLRTALVSPSRHDVRCAGAEMWDSLTTADYGYTTWTNRVL